MTRPNADDIPVCSPWSCTVAMAPLLDAHAEGLPMTGKKDIVVAFFSAAASTSAPFFTGHGAVVAVPSKAGSYCA